MNIQSKDRIISISGHFKGSKGYVCRVESDQACVVFKSVWGHGIWVELDTLKRTKRYIKETNNG